MEWAAESILSVSSLLSHPVTQGCSLSSKHLQSLCEMSFSLAWPCWSSLDGSHCIWQEFSLLPLNSPPADQLWFCCLQTGKATLQPLKFCSFTAAEDLAQSCMQESSIQYNYNQNTSLISQLSQRSFVPTKLGGLYVQSNWKQLLAILAARFGCRRRSSTYSSWGPDS